MAVLDRGREHPLLDGLQRGLVEGGDRPHDLCLGHVALGVDEDLDLDRPLDLLDERFRRVLGLRDLDRPRALAEERGVRMPGFGGYMLYSGAVLIPCFLLVTLLFFV